MEIITCKKCGRALKTLESMARGYGIQCYTLKYKCLKRVKSLDKW